MAQQKYTHIDVPALAIFKVPHTPAFLRLAQNQAQAFKSQVPGASVVLIANADHYLFRTNEDDVLGAINEFVGGLHPGDSGPPGNATAMGKPLCSVRYAARSRLTAKPDK